VSPSVKNAEFMQTGKCKSFIFALVGFGKEENVLLQYASKLWIAGLIQSPRASSYA